MKKFREVYEENKQLDRLFESKYYGNELIMRKNMLSLLVEIGELANETRCFKYWSVKGPSDKDDILEEFADCMLLVLMFCNYLKVSLDEEFEEVKENEVNQQMITLYHLCSILKDNYNKQHIKLVLANLINLAYLLNLSDDEIIEACKKKIRKNFERLEENSNY